MKHRSRNAVVTLTGLSFMLLCFLQDLPGHAAGMRHAYEARSDRSEGYQARRSAGDVLLGEWRVKCEVKTYQNGKLLRSSQDAGELLVVAETDPDGSYQLYKFPVGFGEGFPRLRKVTESLYAGDDTVNGIKTLIKQSVALENGRITIRQTVIDAPGKQPESDTECIGARLQSPARFPEPSHTAETCQTDARPGHLPDRRLARRYNSVRPFSDGMAAVANIPRGARTPKWGFIDETGRLVIPMRYDVVTSFHDGLAAVAKAYGRGRHLKWGVVEKLGPQVTPYVNFDAVKILGGGFAAVGYAVAGRPGLRWNLINRENTIVLYSLDEIGCFVGGRARASRTEGSVVRTGYVDKVGDFFVDK